MQWLVHSNSDLKVSGSRPGHIHRVVSKKSCFTLYKSSGH